MAGVNEGAITSSFGSSDSGDSYVGGVAGLNRGAISDTYAGGVVGQLYVGGLVGWNDTGASITNSFTTADQVTGEAGGQDAAGNDYVGGLAGVNYGSISNSYSQSQVSGVRVVGGLVGTNMPGATVTASYSSGPVSASNGAVGASFGVQGGEVSYVYGFPSLSGQPVESGYVSPSAMGDAVSLAAYQEGGYYAYVGFDFSNTWQEQANSPPTLLPFPVGALQP